MLNVSDFLSHMILVATLLSSYSRVLYLLAKYSTLLQIAEFSNMDLFMQASGL